MEAKFNDYTIKLNPIYALETRVFFFEWLARHNVTANMITVFRALLVIPALILLQIGKDIPFFAIMVGSYWGDHLDGLFARTQNQVTKDGAYLDRTLDKMVNIAVMISFYVISPYVFCELFMFKISILLLCVKESIALVISLRHWWIEKYECDLYEIMDNKSSGAGKTKMLIESVFIMLVPVLGWVALASTYKAQILAIGFNIALVFGMISLVEHIHKVKPKIVLADT